jgi:phosphoglycolate phosphatase-like HAD superfamily hydrolase
LKQYLLFDLDGTLTDPMVGITSSVQYALEKFGIHVRYLKELIPFIGPPLAESFQKFYGFSKEDAEKAIQYYREYYAPKGIFENEVYEGIPEMLAHLTEAGFTLLVATSKPTVFARKVLKHFGMEDYFSFVGGSELDGSRTKKAEVISYILKTCGIEAKEAITQICNADERGHRFNYLRDIYKYYRVSFPGEFEGERERPDPEEVLRHD